MNGDSNLASSMALNNMGKFPVDGMLFEKDNLLSPNVPSPFFSRQPSTFETEKRDGFSFGNDMGNIFSTNINEQEMNGTNHWKMNDTPKSNGTNLFGDMFQPISNDQMQMSMDFPKAKSFLNNPNDLLPKMNFDGPPGFSTPQSKKTRWPGDIAPMPNSVKNGFPGSPLSENVLSSPSTEEARPGSTSGMLGGNFNNWNGNSIRYPFMDFSTMNGYPSNNGTKNIRFVLEINNIFKDYFRNKSMDNLNKCERNFEFLLSLVAEDLKRIRCSSDSDSVRIFEHLYRQLTNSFKHWYSEKIIHDQHCEKFNFLIMSINKQAETGGPDEDQLKGCLYSMLNSTFKEFSLESHNEFFISFVKFYHKMFYTFPPEFTQNFELIASLSARAQRANSETDQDPLLQAYKNFVAELQKHETSQSIPKDLNNNKNLENEPVVNGTKVFKGQEMQDNKHFNSLPIFSNVQHLKMDPSAYMVCYYPVDGKMMNYEGAIPQFTVNKPANKTNTYRPAGRSVIESILDTEFSKIVPGNVVFDVPDEVSTNKSFVKILDKLHHHFPNIEKKQLAEMLIQAKYALVKKDKLHYGFSGMKMKDIVRFVAEFIQEHAVYNSNVEFSKAPGTSSKNGQVSWSKIASSNGQPKEDDRCSSMSPSQSSDKSSNAQNQHACPFCKNIVNMSNPRQYIVAQCSHIYHNQCHEFLLKVKSQCPKCESNKMKGDEFPSL